MNRLQIIVMQLLGQYRKQTLIVGVGLGGTVLILSMAWFVLYVLTAPSVPDPKTATVEEVAAFLSHERGLARFPVKKRKRVFLETIGAYTRDPVQRDMLAERIETMAPSERVVIREAVFEIVKDEFVEDAKKFHQLPEEKREEFLAEKVKQYESFRQEMRGGPAAGGGEGGEAGGPTANKGGGANGRNIGELFMSDPGMPSKSDALAKEMVSRSSPRERALAQPYAERLTKLVEDQRAERKSDWWKR